MNAIDIDISIIANGVDMYYFVAMNENLRKSAYTFPKFCFSPRLVHNDGRLGLKEMFVKEVTIQFFERCAIVTRIWLKRNVRKSTQNSCFVKDA